MEELLRQLLEKIDRMESKLESKIDNVSDKLEVFEKRTMEGFKEIDVRLNGADTQLNGIYENMHDLVEFKIENETKLKKIK